MVLIGGLVGEGEGADALGSNPGAGVAGGSFFAEPGVRLEIDAGDTSSLLRLTCCIEGPTSCIDDWSRGLVRGCDLATCSILDVS